MQKTTFFRSDDGFNRSVAVVGDFSRISLNVWSCFSEVIVAGIDCNRKNKIDKLSGEPIIVDGGNKFEEYILR